MLWALRLLFLAIIGSMLFVTTWAGTQCGLFAIPSEVFQHPWFLATLVDAYWAFLTFFVWVAWKEQAHAARALWFVGIVLLGNLAMAAYFLRELFAIRTGGEIGLVFTRRNPGHLMLAAVLALLGVAIYLFAWLA
jgi:hypothetical protein